MAIGDHWVAFFQEHWRHGIQLDDHHLLTFQTSSDGVPALATVPLTEFQEWPFARIVDSPCQFSRQQVADRAQDIWAKRDGRRFSGSSEYLARWCRSDIRIDPKIEADNQANREWATARIDDPEIRDAFRSLGIYSSQDQLAVLTRLALPGIAISDAVATLVELLYLVSRENQVRDATSPTWQSSSGSTADQQTGKTDSDNQDETRRPASVTRFFKAFGAGAMGMAIGGPLMGAQSMNRALQDPQLGQHSIARTRQWLRDLAQKHTGDRNQRPE